MAKIKTDAFPNLKRFSQLNNYYCGPAVLQMLCSFQNLNVTQDQLVQAAGTSKKIKDYGMTVEEFSQAIKNLFPDYYFWIKKYATIGELSQLVNHYQYPVGVELQGVFEPEDSDDDPGHYCLVTAIDLKNNYILLADPYKRYAGKDRQFSILGFERRWWDVNIVVNPKTKKQTEIDDYHVMFIITPKNVDFPLKLGMNR